MHVFIYLPIYIWKITMRVEHNNKHEIGVEWIYLKGWKKIQIVKDIKTMC